MPKQKAKTCWEYWGCSLEIRKKCPAFGSEKPCWHIAGQYCGRVFNRRGMEKCFTCDWYKINHQG